ncbi:hypothetical protein AALA83_09505, partial [Oscillospiraceae bacterium 44-5]
IHISSFLYFRTYHRFVQYLFFKQALEAPEGYIEIDRKEYETKHWGSFVYVVYERRYRWAKEEEKRPGLYDGADKIVSKRAL